MDSSDDSDNEQIEINLDENPRRFERKIQEIIQQRMNDRENSAGSSIQNLDSQSRFEDLLIKMMERNRNEHEESHNRDEDMFGSEDNRDLEMDYKIAESLQFEEIFDFSQTNVRSNQTEQNIVDDSEESDRYDLPEDIDENGAENYFNDQQFEQLFNEEMIRIFLGNNSANLSPHNNSQSSEEGRGLNDEFSDNLNDLIEDELDKTLESLIEETQNNSVIVNVSNQMSQITIEENYQTIDEEINPFQCQLCIEDRSLEESEGFGCSHIYCKECLKQFFINKIEDGQVFQIKCPAEDCSFVAEDSLIRSLVSNDKIIRYEQLLLKNVIDTMDYIMNCPQCNVPVECDLGSGNGICQECKFAFCTSCRKAFHGFDDCSQIQRRSEDNEKSEHFIRQNLKKCPGCQTNIEKHEIGCNHMTCVKCKTEFCWLCLTKLTTDQLEIERHFSNCILFEHQFVD